MSSIDLEELHTLSSSLVVYVGRELTNAAGLPGQPELARILLDTLPPETSQRRRSELCELVDRGAIADAFTELERELSPARLGLEIERALADDDIEVPPLAHMIAALGARVHGVMTPNLDRLLERAFGATLITHVTPDVRMVQRKGWLLKLNGTLHDRASWVLTRERRARVSWRDPLYSRVLESLLMAHPMLFIGVDFESSLCASMLDELRALSAGAPPRHWAFVPSAQLSRSLRVRLDEAGISAIAYDGEAQLLELLRSLAPESSTASELPPRSAPRPRSHRPHGPLRVLFVSATPRELERLAVDREQRIIRHAFERAALRERIELTTRVAASFADLCNALLELEYDLVHIASHGEAVGTVLDVGGRRVPVPPEQLMALFDEYAPPVGKLSCVVLNSCWSSLAAKIPSRVPTRIAMTGSLDDQAALAFSEGFYDAIGAGRDYARAFREGRRRALVAAPSSPFDAGLFESSS